MLQTPSLGTTNERWRKKDHLLLCICQRKEGIKKQLMNGTCDSHHRYEYTLLRQDNAVVPVPTHLASWYRRLCSWPACRQSCALFGTYVYLSFHRDGCIYFSVEHFTTLSYIRFPQSIWIYIKKGHILNLLKTGPHPEYIWENDLIPKLWRNGQHSGWIQKSAIFRSCKKKRPHSEFI